MTNMKRKRRQQHTNDSKPDPKTQKRDALLREIDASMLSAEDKRLIKLIATWHGPDALLNARNAFEAAVWRQTEGKRWVS